MSSASSASSWYDDATPQRRAFTLAPLLVGGALAVIAMAGETRVGAWLRGFFSTRSLPPHDELRRRVQEGLSLAALRESILGRRKVTIAATFGPPRTAVAARSARAETLFFRADTWYYAVDPHSQTAMAVLFKNGIAETVDFFDAPQSPAIDPFVG